MRLAVKSPYGPFRKEWMRNPAEIIQDRPLRLRNGTLAILILLFVVALMPGCSRQSDAVAPAASAEMMTAPVTAASATQETVPVEVHAIGNVAAYSTVTIKSQEDAVIEQVHFTEGQDVRAGDLLFTLDARPFEARLQQAEATMARDEAQATNARAQALRNKGLFEAGIISKDQYDQFATSADALDASVRADQAAVADAKLQLGYCTIRSPIDGRTGSLLVHAGNLIKSNDTSLVVINQIHPIYVTFSVPEQYLSQIKAHAAKGRLGVVASTENGNQTVDEGVLSFVNNTVDPTTGTIMLKGTFPNAGGGLWPGQFVNVALKLSVMEDATVVPNQAVQAGEKGSYVYVIKPDMTADYRPVVPGATIGGKTVIEKGLEPGEKVVTDGQLRIFPGAKLKIKNPT
jgi:membrane fusion protein, multidrug efflux system